MRRDASHRLAGMDRQTLRDWVHRYNAEGVAGLRDRPRPGRPCGLTEGERAALKALILRGPDPERDGVAAWRIRDPCALAERRFGVRYSETGMLRLVKSVDPTSRGRRRGRGTRRPTPARERASKKACPA